MLKIKQFSRLFILSALMLFAGCAGMYSGFESPEVTLADLTVQEIRPLESSFLVQLRVANPNTTPLEISGLSCELELDDSHFASGLLGSQISIPPYSSALVAVRVHASMLNMVSSVLQWIQSANETTAIRSSISYGLTGHVRVSTGTMHKKLPFESRGELSLNQLHSVR